MSLNEGFDYRERLGPEAQGEPILDYLVRRYRHSSEPEWRERILSGRVRIDSRPVRPDTLIRRGQVLSWRRPAWEEPAAPTEVDILYEDGDLLAVAKPAGLPTLPGAGFLRNTLLHRVRERAPAASPLHRLGRWTSGVLLFARTAEVRADLSRQFADRTVRKRYRALAGGVPERSEFVVDEPIGPVPHPLLGSVHAATATGKPASSHVLVVERREGAYLCDVRIASGRPHQIRIHLAAAGHPLVGDPLYGPGGIPRPHSVALPGDPGYHLHASDLTFRHPRSNRDVTVECAPAALLNLRSRGGSGGHFTT